jgi:hypothetical protein
MNNKKRSADIWLAATHPGDTDYKPMVQQSEMRIPFRNTAGRPQHINFPAIEDRTQARGLIKLAATSDANVPVSYYVVAGPAELLGDELSLTAIPPRTKFPITVTVVAWQYGRTGTSPLQTADSVERSFLIIK